MSCFVYLLDNRIFNYYKLAHFSENWGYICISPILSANLLSFLFGWSLDAHGDKTVKHSAYGPPQCLQGRDCYVDAIYWTIGTTLLSFFLGIWAGYRDSRKVINGDGEER